MIYANDFVTIIEYHEQCVDLRIINMFYAPQVAHAKVTISLPQGVKTQYRFPESGCGGFHLNVGPSDGGTPDAIVVARVQAPVEACVGIVSNSVIVLVLPSTCRQLSRTTTESK